MTLQFQEDIKPAYAGFFMRDYESELIQDIAGFYYDPLGFVRYVFPWGEGELKGETGPDDWQAEQLSAIGRHFRETPEAALQEAIASGHGIGKSAEVSWVILWAMSTRPHLAGWCTANTQSQLTKKTWRELAVWHRRALNKHWFKWTATRFYHVDYPETWGIDAIPWSEHNSEAFAGLHSEHVLMIMDEASAIADVIWEVAEGALTTEGAMWFAYGNPTRNTGRFRECFGKFKHRWKTRQIDSRKAKKTNKAQIEAWINDYGEDSDFVRVRVKGEFPRAGDSQFISVEPVMRAMERTVLPEVYVGNPRYIGVDVARFGGDQSVIIRRQGPKVFEPKCFREIDTMVLAGLVYDEYKNWSADLIFVDGVGVGSGVVDRLKMMGAEVIDVQSGSQAQDKRQYINLRAELWGEMRDWISGEVDIPMDTDLRDELIGPEYGFTAKMQIQLESKQDMKKRGLSSPDIADALAMTFAYHFRPVVSTVAKAIVRRTSRGWD